MSPTLHVTSTITFTVVTPAFFDTQPIILFHFTVFHHASIGSDLSWQKLLTGVYPRICLGKQ